MAQPLDDQGTAVATTMQADRAPALPPDIEIARSVPLERIMPLLERRLGLAEDVLIPHGHYKAKLSLAGIESIRKRPSGKLVLVTAISPTPAGEGKTTTSIGLTDALNRLGRTTSVCLREPSLGPCFGMKGGAAGGGYAQVVPMEDINLHFNGDFHAITTAHNLLAALIDNHLHWDNELDIDTRSVTWRRVVDLNDRSLRHINVGLGGGSHGVPREGGFDITVASEIMAILCLAEDLADLEGRLGNVVIARRRDGSEVTARDLGAHGALAALLRDALQPNLVQTLEHNPAFIHGGPFANIAHGCNSVIATKSALALSDIVVTEAGFGADLGAEKFLDIKCRTSGLRPDLAVLVCTARALKMHGGVAKDAVTVTDPQAVRRGACNLARHIKNLQRFGLTPVVAINAFPSDSPEELAEIEAICASLGAEARVANHWAAGGAGALDLAQAVLDRLEAGSPEVRLLYPDSLSLEDKIRTVATELYGAGSVTLSLPARRHLRDFERLGHGDLPVCIAKTQYSFSSDPRLKGAPEGHDLLIREARLCAGAGFVVAVCGDIMTMPGLPRRPSALDMGLDAEGRIYGLF